MYGYFCCSFRWRVQKLVIIVLKDPLIFQRIPEIVQRAQKLRVTQGEEKGADIGPLISPQVTILRSN
jgi:hypothetical protein